MQQQDSITAMGVKADFANPRLERPGTIVGAPLLNGAGLVIIRQLIERLGIAQAINAGLRLLRRHKPYAESDHMPHAGPRSGRRSGAAARAGHRAGAHATEALFPEAAPQAALPPPSRADFAHDNIDPTCVPGSAGRQHLARLIRPGDRQDLCAPWPRSTRICASPSSRGRTGKKRRRQENRNLSTR